MSRRQTLGQVTFFEIHGLAGRRKVVSHALQPQVNVFWGANGSGKTSMLKILHSALANDATPLLRVPFTKAVVGITGEHDGKREHIRTILKSDLYESDAPRLPSDFELDATTEAVVRRYSLRLQMASGSKAMPGWNTDPTPIQGQAKNGALRHGYLPISRVSEARTRRTHQPAAELIDEASFDRLFAEQIRDLWIEYNNRALSQIRDAQERGIARILSSVLETGGPSISPSKSLSRPVEDAGEAYSLVMSFFRAQRLGAMLRLSREAFIENYDSSSLVQEVVAEVADVQRGIDLAQEPQHRIEALLGRLYGGKKKVELRGREVVVLSGKDAIPLESLSSGEKQLLQLLLECLAASQTPVLIDEPELSLHVDWQNELVQCMRTVNDAAQLIMATHSPEVMANLADNMIFEL